MSNSDFNFEMEESHLKEFSPDHIGSLLRGYSILYVCTTTFTGKASDDIEKVRFMRNESIKSINAIIKILLQNGYAPASIAEILDARINVTSYLHRIIDYQIYSQAIGKNDENMHPIVIIGFSCSGKDTVASLISSKMKAKILNFSSLVKDVLSVRYIVHPKRDDYIETGDMLRKLFGKGILALVISKLLRENRENIICVGPRFLEEVKIFHQSKLIGVRIDAEDPEDNILERFQRDIYRNGTERVPTFDDFLATHYKEREGIQEIISSGLVAHWIMNNEPDLSLSSMYWQIERILGK